MNDVLSGFGVDLLKQIIGIYIRMDEQELGRLRGNPDHPFTRGGLCKKVNPWLTMAADPDRLLRPLRRIAPKGPDVPFVDAFEPISWSEALEHIAARFTSIIDTSGPAAIWPFAGTGNVGFIQGGAIPSGSRLWNHLGVSGHQISICSVSGHVGMSYSTGTAAGMDPEDVARAGVVVIWGSNTLVANRHLWPFVEQARAAGAPLVVIDPVRTRTAAAADLHLAPRVGTDGALALGLCRAIIDRGGVDEAFVAASTVGFDSFVASLEPWTIEHTAEVCGLSAESITDLAALVTDQAPLAVKLGQGMQRHAGGGQTARIVSCLPAVTGAYGVRGGGLVYSTSDRYQFNVAAAAGADLGQRPRHLAMTNLAANLTQLDPPVEAIIISGANPLVSNPRPDLVADGLARTDLFTVVIDLYPTQTTDWADLVLPSTMQHEQFEINDSYNHRYLNHNEPAVAPPGQCLPHTEIERRLAAAMGFTEPEVLADDHQLAADLLDSEVLRAAGISPDALREAGFLPLPARASPTQRPFPTPSGRFQFASAEAERDGHGLVPVARSAAEASHPDPGWLALIAAAGEHQVNSTFGGTSVTTDRWGVPPIVIHPDDAETRGLTTGDLAAVANDRGRFEAVVEVAATVRPGVVATIKGRWHHPINTTVDERDADMASGAVFHDNAVTVTKVASSDPAPKPSPSPTPDR